MLKPIGHGFTSCKNSASVVDQNVDAPRVVEQSGHQPKDLISLRQIRIVHFDFDTRHLCPQLCKRNLALLAIAPYEQKPRSQQGETRGSLQPYSGGRPRDDAGLILHRFFSRAPPVRQLLACSIKNVAVARPDPFYDVRAGSYSAVGVLP